jgi:hypothetical protein
MTKKEKAIIFNRASEYRKAAYESDIGSVRHASFARKSQAIEQLIDELGLTYEFAKEGAA